MRQDLPDLQREYLNGLDLSRDCKELDTVPKAVQIIEQAALLVQDARAQVEALTAVRFTFSERVSVDQCRRAEAQRALGELQSKVRQAEEESESCLSVRLPFRIQEVQDRL